MKKITISVALLASVLTLKAQDTLKYVIETKESFEFVACDRVIHLHLNDKKNRLRKVYLTYPDGEVYYYVVESKDNYYWFEKNVKVNVSKPKLLVWL
tara:strand:+ start:590 stop:880 length:291 start_codon:yes stop_codon:yes gene_type:complete